MRRLFPLLWGFFFWFIKFSSDYFSEFPTSLLILPTSFYMLSTVFIKTFNISEYGSDAVFVSSDCFFLSSGITCTFEIILLRLGLEFNVQDLELNVQDLEPVQNPAWDSYPRFFFFFFPHSLLIRITHLVSGLTEAQVLSVRAKW